MSDARALLRAHIEAKHNAGRKPLAKAAEAFASPQSGFLDPHRGPIPAGDRDRVLTSYLRLQAGKGHNRQELEALVSRRWQDAEQPAGNEYPLEAALAKVPRALEKFAPVDELPEGVPQAIRDELEREGVAREVARIQDRRVAQRIDAEIEALRHPKTPLDVGTLTEMKARPEVPRYRIEGLLPREGRCLLVAKRKDGKTTLANNMAVSLITGEPLLGTFAVHPLVGTVLILNFEVAGAQASRWFDGYELTSEQEGRIVLANVRGRGNPFASSESKAELIALMRARNVEFLIVDPFGRAFTGENQDSTSQVTPWLAELDRVATEGGAQEVLLVVHAGWGGEGRNQVRARGASALEDWPDSIIRYGRQGDDGARYLEAEGRDVLVEKDRVDFDPTTRRLAMSGAGGPGAVRLASKATALADPIVGVVTAQGGISTAGIAAALRQASIAFRKGEDAAAIRQLVEAGRIVRHRDGQSVRHWLPTAVPTKFRELTTFPIVPSNEQKEKS